MPRNIHSIVMSDYIVCLGYSKFLKQILKELQLLGVSEATLFPETDKIMHEIKSQIKH